MNTVLVIEDNPANMELMAYLLEQHGYRVLRATDGPQGLALFRQQVPQLVICDINLPGMDGLMVLRALREMRELPAVPIVAVTALAMRGDRERLLEAGFDAYLPKPIEPRTFVDQVRSWMRPGQGN